MALELKPSATRLPGLDLLRAGAILLVLFAHGPVPSAGDLPSFMIPIMQGLKRGGWVGVDLFFVLSGFLVSGLLMREHLRHGTVNAWRFLIRRGWKIYPAMIAYIVFMVPFERVMHGYWPIDRTIAQVLFIQSYTPGLQTHMWSLAVEEHAYLLIALVFGVCAWIARRKKSSMQFAWLPAAIVAGLVLVLLARLFNASSGGFTGYTHQFPTHLRIDSILAGVLLAYYYHYHAQATARVLQQLRLPLLIAGVLLLMPVFLLPKSSSPWIYTYGFTTNYLAGVMLLGGMLAYRPEVNNIVTRCLVSIGKHSYSIYLWHLTAYFILMWAITGKLSVTPQWDGPYVINLMLYAAVAISVGVVLSVLIEVPMLKLRDRLSPSRSGQIKPIETSQSPLLITGQQRITRRAA